MKHICLRLLFILYILMSLHIKASFCQPVDVYFDHLTNEDGLGSSTVHSICRDAKGFIWIGTSAGLYRYDGYKLKAFLNNQKNEKTLAGNRINTMLFASDNTLYVGTWDNGLSVYDYDNESFINYNKASKKYHLKSNEVKCIFEDSKKNIWLAMTGNDAGLFLLDKKTKQFADFKLPEDNRCLAVTEDKNGLLWLCSYNTGLYTFNPQTKVFTKIIVPDPVAKHIEGWAKKMVFDKKGNLWIATCGSGLYCYNPVTKRVKHWDDKTPSLGCSNIWDIHVEKDGNLWLATDGQGLVWLDAVNDTFLHFKNESTDQNSINTNAVYSLFKDDVGILWIGTFNGGVNIYNPNKLKFNCYKHIASDSKSLSNKSVLSVYEDIEKNIWVGTDGGGLDLFQGKNNEFIHFKPDPSNPNQTAPSVVKSIFQDSQKRIWIGTWGRGLVLFDPKTKRFDYSYSQTTRIDEAGVWAILEDDDRNLWVSALGKGVKKIDPKTFKYKDYSPYTRCGLSSPNLLCLFKDSKHRIWCGSEGFGLYLYQPATERFKNFSNDTLDAHSIAGDVIRTIFEDHKGRLWIGTLGHGLCLFNEQKSNFTNFGDNDGLIGNTVNSIQEDKSGNLWIGTNNGMMKFNPDTKKIRSFDRFDGLQSNDFNYCSSTLSSDGDLFFGGLNGLNRFNPEKIKDNMNLPPVFITGLSIFNTPVEMNAPDQILSKSILSTTEITLTHKQSVITFNFSALNFTHSLKNGYAYMLEKFESKWNYVGSKREATYTNLDPGEYIFRVKACNNDGVWNEAGTSLKVIILPPFWKTWWFRLAIVITVAGGAWVFFSWRIMALKKQKQQLEEKVNERTKELNDSNIQLRESQAEIRQQAEELVVQKDALMVQNNQIIAQNNHITASVRYAQTLQKAILPSLEPIEKHLECFSIYMPKDIVSGDCYWYANLNDKNNIEEISDRYILSVIDCTGHGVPGAFMTLVADRLMYEAVVEHGVETPCEILEELDKGIQSTLKQETNTNRDGMDLVVCLFEHQADKSVNLTFAGSKNPLFYYDSSQHAIVKVEADRRYIGMMGTKAKVQRFTQKQVQLKKGDVVFLCTDGYIDQSNDERKRLGTKLFTEYLLEFSKLPVNEMKQQLEDKLKQWQGNQAQRDDISLIGIRI